MNGGGRLLIVVLYWLVAMWGVSEVLAQTPDPPPPLDQAQHYVAYDAYCPSDDGLDACTIYVVRHRQCELEPARQTPFEQADMDGNGCVGVYEYGLLLKFFGECEKGVP